MSKCSLEMLGISKISQEISGAFNFAKKSKNPSYKKYLALQNY